MNRLCVTIDVDWASEAALRHVVDYFESQAVPLTFFTTHDSDLIRGELRHHEVGLHPFFGGGSDHGEGVRSVVNHVLRLPHNIAAFRCHRFATSNESQEALAAANMLACSNVCTDLAAVPPYVERNGLLEVPIFFEDGGYLKRGHSLHDLSQLVLTPPVPAAKVLLIHPMHFCLNTPDFAFMRRIKDSLSRKQWNGLSAESLADLAFGQRGIRDLVKEWVQSADSFVTFSELCHPRLIKA